VGASLTRELIASPSSNGTHHDKQVELADPIAEGIQLLGAVSLAIGADVAETTKVDRPPRSREEVHIQLSRLLVAHKVIIGQALSRARRASRLGNEGINDLVVSEVFRTNELQTWFLSEHPVNVPWSQQRIHHPIRRDALSSHGQR
jgi:starvation-inducible DNA-binding protein